MQAQFDDFLKLDIRTGTIIDALEFAQARNPAYILKIDFGDAIGIKKSSAQITHNYLVEDLIGMKVMAVVNFPEKQIGSIMSQVLVLGFADENGAIVLATVDKSVPDGQRLH